jgi:MerR family copper efflux transcriptional regulator
VKAIAEAKLTEIDRKIAELASLRNLLSNLVHNCNGDERPDCAIIDGLAGSGTGQ